MLQQNFPMDNQTTKLCILIAPKEDADRLTDALVAHDYQSTQISSSGGFLRKGSTTIFCALNEDQIFQRLLSPSQRRACLLSLSQIGQTPT